MASTSTVMAIRVRLRFPAGLETKNKIHGGDFRPRIGLRNEGNKRRKGINKGKKRRKSREKRENKKMWKG